MRKKKTLRAAAAVAMTGCLMSSTCLSIDSGGLNDFTDGLFGSLETAVTDGIGGVDISGILSSFIETQITNALP